MADGAAQSGSTTIDAIMRMAPVIPVLVLDATTPDPAALAETLVAAGLPVIEVTLRTPEALPAMRAMARVPGACVGAGTVTSAEQLRAVAGEGARFIVSPGLTETITRAALEVGVPYLPGVATAGDILRGMELRLDRFKFFPAEASGGLPALKALVAPFFEARFCPTGGITAATAPAWLAEPAVLCVGGSWIVPKGVTDLDAIHALAAKAARIRP